MTTYSLTGQILERGTPRGVPNLRIEAWDSESIVSDVIAVTTTDANGSFSITLDSEYLRAHFGDRSPSLAFRVFKTAQIGLESGDLATTYTQLVLRYFLWKLPVGNTTVRLEVDLSAPTGLEPHTPSIVRGVVRTAAGVPSVEVIVNAYDQNLTGDDLLGSTATDAAGRYQIAYTELSRTGKLRPDLVVRVIGFGNVTLAESDRVCHAPATVTVDLSIGGEYRGPSEYDALVGRLAPLTAGFDLGLATEEHIEHLACGSETDTDQVSSLATALSLSRGTGLSAPVMYGLLRKGLPADRRALLMTRPVDLRRALEEALADNLVPATLSGTLDSTMTALRQATIALAFEAPPAGATGSLGDLLATVLPTQSIQEELLDVYLSHVGTLGEFWDALALRTSFQTPGRIANLQLAFQLGALTRQHFPLLRELQARKTAGTLSSFRDLAAYSEADWAALLDLLDTSGSPIGYPSDIPGASAAEKKAGYAKVLKSTMESAFPTDALKHDIERTLPPGGLSLMSFFDDNPSFEIGKNRVGDYLANNPTALSSYTTSLDSAAVVVKLKAVERLYRVTPKYSEMALFLDDGHDSARSLVRMGQGAFVAQYGSALGGSVAAETLFDKARAAADHALAVQTVYNVDINSRLGYGLPGYVPSAGSQPTQIADYKTLFGSPDGCECEHCSSVYSAAAYLVDLLQFLGRYESKVSKGGGGLWSAREILIGNKPTQPQPERLRRPDIGWLVLSCDNTDTPVPYVDLVNEILAHSVASSPAIYNALIETQGTAEDLASLPQVLESEKDIQSAAYATLATAVHPFEVPFHLWAEEARVYLQHLGVPRGTLMYTLRQKLTDEGAAAEQRALIASERVGLTPYERQIITVAPPELFDLPAFWGVSSLNLSSLENVPTFLKRSGLEYADLQDLVECAFLNFFEPRLEPVPGGSACKPDQMLIVWGTDTVLVDAWAAVHRFLRLQRRLDWSIRELDQVVTACLGALGDGVIDDACLEVIAVALRLQAEWEVPIPVLASWFGDLDTQRRDGGSTPSYYEQIFVNKAVSSSGELDLTLHSGLVLSEHVDAVRGALHIDAADFTLLTSATAQQRDLGLSIGSVIVGTAANLGNLSKLHRIVTFARAAGLSIKDFLQIGYLSGVLDQTTAGTQGFKPEEVESFLEVLATVRRSTIAPVDLAYLLCRQELPGATVIPDDAVVRVMLRALYGGLRKIALEQHDADVAVDAEQRLIRQTLSASLKLNLSTTTSLLDKLLTLSGGASPKLIEAFELPSQSPELPAELLEATEDAQVSAYRHLAVAAKLIGKLDLTTGEVSLLGATLFVLDATPREPSAADHARFTSFLKLVELRAFRGTLTRADQGLLSIFNELIDFKLLRVARETGWPFGDINALLIAFSLEIGEAGQIATTVEALLRLRDAFVLLKRLGVSAAKAIDWTNTSAPIAGGTGPTAQEIAGSIIQAAKSKYGADAWSTVAPPIRDVLREKQRKALVAYLVAKNDYVDSDELFARLLVDVETSPAQLTSRIKQAIGSVQTFVQRSLLNLEAEVSLPADAAHEWEWMKSYRVWEANRKVFLYPENWIEPALRDDKSPFFKSMESELRQKDMTADVAETAFGHYLERLHDVAHLDVVAMYHQEEEAKGLHPSINILHVIGRTVSAPHKHFYRTRVDGAQWTPWEAVDLDIESDHLLLTVVNRRLHLLWALIEEKADPSKDQPISDPNKPGQDARTHVQVRLAWSEYRSKKWTTRKLSRGDVVVISAGGHPDPKYLTLIPATHGSVPGPVIALWVNTAYAGDNPGSMSYQGCFLLNSCGDVVESFPRVGDEIKLVPPGTLMVLPSGSELRAQDAAQVSGSDLTMPFYVDGQTERDVVLASTADPYRILSQHHYTRATVKLYHYPGGSVPQLFYKDSTRTFLVELKADTETELSEPSRTYPGVPVSLSDGFIGSAPISSEMGSWANHVPTGSVSVSPSTSALKGYQFFTFYHPYACFFMEELNRSGVDGLLKWSLNTTPIQLARQVFFETTYQPNPSTTAGPYPVDDVDFSFRGAYSLYNWELFFHAPFLIATRLMDNQQFADAQRWFHYIFDPTSGGAEKAPKRFWKVRPFYENVDLASIEEELATLAEASWSVSSSTLAALLGSKGDDPKIKDLQAQIEASRRQPFNPHVIARLRPLAYQKAVFLKYVENLLAWGDQLFRRDTIEAINEATQLYILAGGILGKRPRRVQPRTTSTAKSYWQLDELGLDAFSDAVIETESLGPLENVPLHVGLMEPAPDLRLTAFCVPPNDAMLGLWDSVADRLFKIRHSMNLEGVVRQLPLFEPPIDPALLVQATALGVDLATALDDAAAPVPLYRFAVMHAKAMEICGSVIGLGGAFLSALEKKDAEGLSRLRSGHEIEMLKLVRETKAAQLKDAENNLVVLQKSLDVVQTRYDYYSSISFISAAESEALTIQGEAALVGTAGQIVTAAAPAAQNFPTVTFGTAGTMGSPVTVTMQGGNIEAPALVQEGQALSIASSLLREGASVVGTLAGYERRANEWKLQAQLAQKEIVQIQKQIVGAQIRVAMAEADLAHHERQIEQTQEVDDYLRDKFTSEDLYDRMVGQLSTVYFESYKLAYDVAKKAEKAFKFELGIDKMSPNMVTFGYWDSLKQGLLAGEQLQYDLRRLEVSYLDQNARELEIIKHISLAEIAPEKLLELRETGACSFDLKESLFDADYPQHYMRRIKSVSVTLPAVTGPYTGVSCSLLLKNNRIRRTDSLTGGYASSGDGDTRFMVDSSQRGPIVTSSAQNDAGLFEVSLRDERYLPFEGAGVIGTWSVELPKDTNGFDISTIEDLILHVRYTARQSNSTDFKGALKPKPATQRIFSARAEFPNSWAQFMDPPPSGSQVLTFGLDRSLFPYVAPSKEITLSKVKLYARWAGEVNYGASAPLYFSLAWPAAGAATDCFVVTPSSAGAAGNLAKMMDLDIGSEAQKKLGDWTFTVSSAQAASLATKLRTNGRVDGTLQDIWMICEYTTQALT